MNIVDVKTDHLGQLADYTRTLYRAPELRKLFFDAGFEDIRIEKDYAGHDRYAFAVLP